jgi:hypothetical protein
MKKQWINVLAVTLLGTALVLGVVHAAQQVPDDITMDNPVFGKHKKSLVNLSHKKHGSDYKIACAQCHHAYKDGKNIWKEGDKVEKCAVCHKEAKAPKAKKGAPQMSKADKIKNYYYSAIHENCVGCHKAEKKKGKKTPSACKDCHPKK